jgi:hypothetical protein
MRVNPTALLVFVLFCLLLTMALSSSAGWVHVAEAVVSVLIVLNLGGYFLRERNRTR